MVEFLIFFVDILYFVCEEHPVTICLADNINNFSTLESLESTTFSGRRFTRKQLASVIETIRLFPGLSRKELAFTVCEHLAWKSPNGSLKVNSAINFLEKIESLGLVALPAKRASGKKGHERVMVTEESVERPAIHKSLDEISPVELVLAETPEDRQLWNEMMERYHYLGYRKPFGAHLKYFVVARGQANEKIGCLLFASSAFALSSRDQWIGWKRWHRVKRLHLIVSNSRFLLFPWVQVSNLASHVLSLIPNRLESDWYQKYKFKPVLIETFVDREKFSGTCYKAANWQLLGHSKGQGCFSTSNQQNVSIKDYYVYPLHKSFRDILIHGQKPEKSTPTPHSHGKIVEFWDKVVHIVKEVAAEFDGQWQIRKRVIDSMLLIMLLFRLVSSKARQGYGTTIDALWDHDWSLRQHLPQKDSIAPSSFTVARHKLHESVFKIINERIVALYGTEIGESCRWYGHRLFAVDGSKMNLPHALISAGYRVPAETAHYPQGLVSCLYQLQARIPWDFELADHEDERKCAVSHLKALRQDDVVVYDRGYFSCGLLFHHQQLGIHAIFRLSSATYKPIVNFIQSSQTEAFVTLDPSDEAQQQIRESFPGMEIKPMALRLIKYTSSGTTYILGTTLLDPRYEAEIFPDAYHARWGIEELYKVSKQVMAVEEFHSKTLRGVKQELYAHFVLITMNRIFANHADDSNSHEKSSDFIMKSPSDELVSLARVNFKNCISAFVRNLEALFLQHADSLKQTVVSLVDRIRRRRQKVRPNRSYPRISMKPVGKWRPNKIANQPIVAVA